MIRKKIRFILYISLIVSVLFFLCSLLRPIRYTATSLFKMPEPHSSLLQDLISPEQKEAVQDDHPLLLINSHNVLSRVVKTLHLQGYIDCNRSFFLHRIWQNLYLERSFAALSSHDRPKSEILTKDILVPNASLFFSKPSALGFHELVYDGDVHCLFFIQFLNEDQFLITSSKKEKIGVGKLNERFYFEKGHFTLTGKSMKGCKKIHLIPLKSATESLKQSISIKKNKKKPGLLQISYTNRNVHLAVDIVNAVMTGYQKHLDEQSKETMKKQLAYLKERREEALEELNILMKDQQLFLKKHVHDGGFMQLEKESLFLMNKKAELSNLLLELKMQILQIAPMVHGCSLSFETILKNTHHFEANSCLALNQVKESISENLKLIEEKELQKKHYEYFLEKSDPSNTEILMKSLPKQLSIIGEIQTIYTRLHDQKNWSPREKEIFQEELNTKKELLHKELSHLKEAESIQIALLQEKLASLQKFFLSRLCLEYEKIKIALTELREQEFSFPEKWMKEESLSLNTKMTLVALEQISKAMEGKNISAHMIPSKSYPFEWASFPILPHPPKLLQKSIIAGLFGAIASIIYLLIKLIREGPSATFINLKGLKMAIMGEALLHPRNRFADCEPMDQKCLKNLSMKLTSSSTVFLTCQKSTSFWKVLLELMAARKEKIALIHLQKGHIEGFDNFTYDTQEQYLEEQLSSSHFFTFLEDLKRNYDRLFLIHIGPIPSSLPNHISSTVLFITTETLSILPKEALLITERKLKKIEKKVYLKEIGPLIDALNKRVIFSPLFTKIFQKR